ncbi:uncharacterized protein EV154DRAFT_486241 [Mucor mucedo]|uniref:uncharacterized protein n=1 Tax=Mucor mucedo TaxID=29922 RepID=UPI002220ED9C|nr:uncharacterized protein EV154DRAFT_486241 [Mucor mucedo]KAI7878114.1 hypothetical protein EV154DRAFT_486241 [Mucor mucedo]
MRRKKLTKDNYVPTSLDDNSNEEQQPQQPQQQQQQQQPQPQQPSPPSPPPPPPPQQQQQEQKQEDGVTEAEALRPVLVNPDPEAQFQAELDNWAQGLQAQLTDVVANTADDVLDLVAIIDDPRWRVVTFRFRLPSPISMPPSPRP